MNNLIGRLGWSIQGNPAILMTDTIESLKADVSDLKDILVCKDRKIDQYKRAIKRVRKLTRSRILLHELDIILNNKKSLIKEV